MQGRGQVVNSENVEMELGTLAVKEVDTKKEKAVLGAHPEKIVDSEKMKAG